MFIQVIQGHVPDVAAARATMDRWRQDCEPGAIGWLGGTYGVTADGTLLAVVRFESAAAAAANAARPEQAVWWEQMAAHFDGDVTFHDCADVTVLLAGGSDEAGFVQVIQGRVLDRDRARHLVERAETITSGHRPDVIGATLAIDADGHFTETVAFTSEDEARRGEARALPPEVQAVVDEQMALLSDVTYHDLHDPWFAAHR